MADGANGLSQIAQQVQESLVKPVTDEVGKDLETAQTQITSAPQTPKDPVEEARLKHEQEEKKRKDQLFH